MENNPISMSPKPTDAASPEKDVKAEKMKQFMESSTKTLAVFGLIAILFGLSFGIIKFAPGVIRAIASAAVSLSSVFIPAEKLSANSNKYTVVSGETFEISWARESNLEDGGSYTISYPCADGLHLESIGRGENEIIFCNTAYRFLNNGNKLSLTAISNKSGQIEVPITVYFTQNGESSVSAQATTRITVSSSGAAIQPPVAPSTNTGTSKPVAGTPREDVYLIPGTGTAAASNPNGYIDLTARILDTGYISTSTDSFYAAKEVKRDQRAAIRFEIVNQGTKTVSDWTFAVVLPTFPEYIFQSNTQQSLAPGDKIQFTLGFDKIKQQQENDFLINVDPIGSVNEPNKTNNLIRGKIYVNLQ